MNNTRLPNWTKALSEVITDYHNKPFVWGESDCCVFGADCVKAVVGTDPMEAHRGHYTTRMGAAKALVKYGSIEEAMHSFPRIHHALKQRGDVCVHISDDNTLSIAVWWADAWFAMTTEGIRKVQIEPLHVWGVGHG